MARVKRVILILLGFGMVVSRVGGHTDPPLMHLLLQPANPAVQEPVTLRIRLRSMQSGTPTVGARIRIEIRPMQGQRLGYTAKPGTRAGEYVATVVFPQVGRWTLHLEVAHANEMDTRDYTVQVVGTVPQTRQVMTDETRLFQHPKAPGQPVSPLVLLLGFVVFIVVLLVAVTILKRVQTRA